MVPTDVAVRGYLNQLRHMTDADAALILELPQIARSHGGRFDLPARVLEDCIDLVLQKFSFLGIHEIKEAYLQFSAGEFNAKGGAMYGGEFNAGNLGAVLAGYNLRRKKIVAAYIERMTDKKFADRKETERQQAREAFDRKFPQLLREYSGEWQDVPAFWYDAAQNRRLIDIDVAEAQSIYKEAKRYVIQEKKVPFACEVLSGVGTIDEQAKIAARKITVFRKLIEPMQKSEIKPRR